MNSDDPGWSEETGENSDIEISDLPPERREHFLLLKLISWIQRWLKRLPFSKPGGRQKTRQQINRRRILAGSGITVVLLLLLLGNITPLRAYLPIFSGISTPTPRTESNAVVFVNSGPVIIRQDQRTPSTSTTQPATDQGIGILPAFCPRASTLQEFNTPLDPPGLGGGPLWLTGFTGPVAALTHLQRSQSGNKGWETPLTLFVARGFSGTILLSGEGQNAEGPLHFFIEGKPEMILTLGITITSTNSTQMGTQGNWIIIPIVLTVPEAGCYSVQTHWDNTDWVGYFAVGQ